MFTTQGQAKRFFVDKIAAQAAKEGAPLSDAERQMLSFYEFDPEFVVNPALVENLQAEISDDDYEAKIAGWIERSWKREGRGRQRCRTPVPQSLHGAQPRRSLLADHAQTGAPEALRPWWAFWR